LTAKHQKNENGNVNGKNDNIKVPKNARLNYVCYCGKIYKHSSGLSRHKNANNCIQIHNLEQNNILTEEDEPEFKILTNLVLEVVKQNQELMTQREK